MAETIFFRLLASEDKGGALLDAIEALRQGGPDNPIVYAVEAESFRQVPGTPFAYWVSERIRRLFTELPPFEGDGRTVRVGLQTSDDFRFVRAWWEVPAERILDAANGPDWREDLEAFQAWCRRRTTEGKRWAPFAKGGEYSPYYADIHLVVNWELEGVEMRAFSGSVIRNPDYYFRPGLTFPRLTRRFCPKALPAGCMFSHGGQAVFPACGELPHEVLGVTASLAFHSLLAMRLPRADADPQYEVGEVQHMPYPLLVVDGVRQLASDGARARRKLEAACETSSAFVIPLLLSVRAETLSARKTALDAERESSIDELRSLQAQIDELGFSAYRVHDCDREDMLSNAPRGTSLDSSADGLDLKMLGDDLLSFAVGCALGTWDVRFALGDRSAPELPDPFDPLPVCPPGMLIGDEGLPTRRSPADYPLRISWDGVLVDDPGFNGGGLHREDVVRRVRDVLTVFWGDRADEIEQDACEILGVQELREWFRRPAGFFQDHLKRYSKSRRKAPIYWPLSTHSGDYTLWVYYHRLTDQTLYTLVNKFVEPKIDELQRSVATMGRDVEEGSGRAAAKSADRIADAQSLLSELSDLREELLRVAGLPYKPNLNDGVIINAAPLHRLFRHRKWAQNTEAVWKKLEKGEYDWSHMAYSIWPDRVKNVCKKDLSIAIAHGLEELYEGPKPGEKKKRKTRKKAKTEATS